MFYDTLGKFTDRNVEKFTEVPKSDDFGPNTGVPEGKEYGYIHAYRKPGRGRADNHGYVLSINKFMNSSSSARYIFRGYFKPKISGDHTFSQNANSGVGGFMIGQSATNPSSKPTEPNNSSVPRTGKLMGAGPKKTTSGTIKLEAGKIYPFRYVLGGRGEGTLSFKDPEGVSHSSFEGFLHFTPKNFVIYVPESEQNLPSQQEDKEETTSNESGSDEIIVNTAAENQIVDADDDETQSTYVDEENQSAEDNSFIYIISGISLLVLFIILYLILSR